MNAHEGVILIYRDDKPVPCTLNCTYKNERFEWKIVNDFLGLKKLIPLIEDRTIYYVVKRTVLWLLEHGRVNGWFEDRSFDAVFKRNELSLEHDGDFIYINETKVFFESNKSEQVEVSVFGRLNLNVIKNNVVTNHPSELVHPKISADKINMLAQLNMLNSIDKIDDMNDINQNNHEIDLHV